LKQFKQESDEQVGSDQVIDSFCTMMLYMMQALRTEGKTAFKEAAGEIFDDDLLFTHHMRHNPIIEVNVNWKTSRYAFDFSYMTDFNKGWVKESFIDGVPGELNWKSAVPE
jgi:hypothetical protein